MELRRAVRLPQELTTARAQGVFDVADRTELYLYADKGYLGGEGPTLLTRYNGPTRPDLAREANRCHTAIRTNAKPGLAVLKNWQTLTRGRACPNRSARSPEPSSR